MAAGVSSDHNLEELLQKVTDPCSETVDELAINLFCSAVRADPTLIKKSTELIVSKIKSPNVTQSRKAIDLLEECMSKCGSEFQMAVARFQFLNELIRLVSKKFSGDDTPSEIRNKILDCLSLWTVQYPERVKIKEAYETLLRSGVQHEVTPTISTCNKRTDFIDGENEKLLKKLLSSKNRDDFQRANLLIQYLVKQDAKKTELAARQRAELQEARNSATLLNQITDRWVEDGIVGDLELAKEIYNLCVKSKSIVIKMPEIIEDNEQLLGDAIEVNEILHGVIVTYDQLVSNETMQKTSTKTETQLADLLAPSEAHKEADTKTPLNPLDELSDIFSQNLKATPIAPSIDLLEPIAVKATPSLPKVEPCIKDLKDQGSLMNGTRTLPDIDKLSEELFMESLNSSQRIGTFKKEPTKIAIKDLVKESSKEDKNQKDSDPKPNEITTKEDVQETSQPKGIIDVPVNFLDILGSTKASEFEDIPEGDNTAKHAISNDDKDASVLLLDDLLSVDTLHPMKGSDESLQKIPTLPIADDEEIIKITEEVPKKVIKHLSEINIELDSIQPGNERPRIVMDDIQGLRVTLNFALDRPSPNVSVIVISTINQSSSPISEYQFDASVPKPCKLRLLAPTGSNLPGVKPFRPPTDDIQQILLLSNPTQKPVDLTCIIGYQQGDDPDPIKESVVVKDIPCCE